MPACQRRIRPQPLPFVMPHSHSHLHSHSHSHLHSHSHSHSHSHPHSTCNARAGGRALAGQPAHVWKRACAQGHAGCWACACCCAPERNENETHFECGGRRSHHGHVALRYGSHRVCGYLLLFPRTCLRTQAHSHSHTHTLSLSLSHKSTRLCTDWDE